VKGHADSLRYERSRYIVRRFVPAVVLMLALFIAGLAIDVSLVHWIATISGFSLAVYLFFIRIAAEKKFPPAGR
jgi:general stress protein CsbA